MTELEPITPREALEMYLQDIDGDLSPNSLQAKEYQLGYFVRWCEGVADIENLTNIKGRDFTRFKNWRGEDIGQVTLKTNLSALRTFMEFCVKIDAVDGDVPDKINVPTLDQGENRRETMLERTRREQSLTTSNASSTRRSTTVCSCYSGRLVSE